MQNGFIGEIHCSRPKLVNGSENRCSFIFDKKYKRKANINALRPRPPGPWASSPQRNLPDSDAGRPRSPCHSAHEWPPRGSSEPARVSGMLGQAHRPVGGFGLPVRRRDGMSDRRLMNRAMSALDALSEENLPNP